MPARPARNAADTLSRSLPMHDTMPMPVTTTRRCVADAGGMSEALGGSEQANAQVVGDIDFAAVDGGAAVGDHHPQLAAHHPADVDLVADQFRVRHHLAAELH